MPVRDRSRHRENSFIHEIEQGAVSFSDDEFTMIKLFVERRGRDAAQVTVTPVDTIQYCSRRSPCSEIPSDVCVSLEKDEEGKMNPEPDRLESPPANTGFETPGQQCYPNWETVQTTTAGCLTAGVGSNLGGDTSSPTECVGTRTDIEITTAPAASTPFSCNRAANPTTRRH